MDADRTIVFVDGQAGGGALEREVLDARGYELVLGQCTNDDEIVALAADARAIIIGVTPFGASVIERLPNLQVVVRMGVGYDNIDVAAATKAGVIVCNVTDYGMHEVANHAFSMLLALNRSIVPLDRGVREGSPKPSPALMPNTGRFFGQTLGLMSFGAIAQQVAARASGFQMNVLAFDPYVDPAVAERMGVRLVSMEELFAESDYISVHTPLSDATHHLIGAAQFSLMKPSAYLVVTSRGGVVDEVALADALRDKKLAGAGLDVWEIEPPAADHPLLQLDNVIGSMHAAFYSEVSVVILRQRVADAAADVLDGVRPRAVVNPEVLDRFDLKPRQAE